MAKKWVDDAQNEAKGEASLRADADKAWGATEQKVQDLSTKLLKEERGRQSAEARLKTVER